MSLNKEHERLLCEAIGERFAKCLDEIRSDLKSKEVFKLDFLNCEPSDEGGVIYFAFIVNDTGTKVGIESKEIISESFAYIFHKVLAVLLLINGGK